MSEFFCVCLIGHPHNQPGNQFSDDSFSVSIRFVIYYYPGENPLNHG